MSTIAGSTIRVGNKIGNQTEDSVTVRMNAINNPTLSGGRLKLANITIGPTAYASIGTNTTDIAGQFWITDIWVPVNRTITKVGVLQGGTATTDNVLVAIYNSRGNLVGSSAVAGSLLSGANTFKELNLVLDSTGAAVTSLSLHGPQQYFVAIQGNGTAAGAIRTVATNTYLDVTSALLAGTFGTIPASITTPSTFTADLAPVVYFA